MNQVGNSYRKFMAEYEALGHITVVEEPGYVISYNAVWKEGADQCKLRVVSDASGRCDSDQSLDDTL